MFWRMTGLSQASPVSLYALTGFDFLFFHLLGWDWGFVRPNFGLRVVLPFVTTGNFCILLLMIAKIFAVSSLHKHCHY